MKKAAVFLTALLMLALTGCRGAQGELSQAGPDSTPAPAVSEEQTPTPEPAKTPASDSSTEAGQSSAREDGMLTEEQAKEKALAHAGLDGGSVEFTKVKLELEDGQQVYELEFFTDTYDEYEYEIDAYTGEVLEWEQEPGND